MVLLDVTPPQGRALTPPAEILLVNLGAIFGRTSFPMDVTRVPGGYLDILKVS